MSPVVASLQNGDAAELKRKRALEDEAVAAPVAKQPVHQPSNANTFDNDKAESWRENLRCVGRLGVGDWAGGGTGGGGGDGGRHQLQGCRPMLLHMASCCQHACLHMQLLLAADQLPRKAVLGRGVPSGLRPHAWLPV